MIKRNGGTVTERLSKRTDFFIQSYNATICDERLASASRVGALVLPSAYVSASLKHARCLGFEEFCLGLDPWPALRISKEKLLRKFRLPLPEWREEEELPQGFEEFLENEERLRVTENGPRQLCVFPLHVERISTSKGKKHDRRKLYKSIISSHFLPS